jgi:DNA-binding transcriptional ArsR family regulator
MSDVQELSDNGEADIADPPGYELDERIAADTPERMKALGNPLRNLIIDLVLERAMSVTELAERTGKAKGTIAHHVDVLVAAGLLKVVRTRQVRAVVERFYGRTARTFMLADESHGDDLPFFQQARREADLDLMRTDCAGGFTMRHARIPAELAAAFTRRLHELAVEFSRAPRDGDREYALLVGVFPTNRPVSPRAKEVA